MEGIAEAQRKPLIFESVMTFSTVLFLPMKILASSLARRSNKCSQEGVSKISLPLLEPEYFLRYLKRSIREAIDRMSALDYGNTRRMFL